MCFIVFHVDFDMDNVVIAELVACLDCKNFQVPNYQKIFECKSTNENYCQIKLY